MAGKLVVVGSSNIDLVMKMARLPRVGETVTDATFVQAFGGKGANQAVGAARAGGEVTFVSCVGDDAYGAQVRGSLEADGIDYLSAVYLDSHLLGTHQGMFGRQALVLPPGALGSTTRELALRVWGAGALPRLAASRARRSGGRRAHDHGVKAD